MILLISVFTIFLAATALAWLIILWATGVFARHRRVFEHQAGQGLTEMFLFLDPAQVWGASMVVGLVLALTALGLSGHWWVALVVGISVLAVPQYGLRLLRHRRLRQLDAQLPDLLLALAGALRAGTGIQAALHHVGSHMPAPLAHELALMQREQRMGVSLEQALQSLAQRVPTEGVQLVVSALHIAIQTGGSLAQMLERIAATLRARLHLQGRIRALTAQGRMQAWVMAILPVALAAVLSWLDPEGMEKLWTTPQGWLIIAVVVGLELAGLLLIRRIVSIQV